MLEKGSYPKSFENCNLVKIIHDNILDTNDKDNKVSKIISYYNLIFCLENQIKNNKISPYFKTQINNLRTIPNLFKMYFSLIRKMMLELNIRDDIIMSNDTIHRNILFNLQKY